MTETIQLTLRPLLKYTDRMPLSNRIEQLMNEFYTSRGWVVDDFLDPLIILLSAYGAGDPFFEDCEAGQELRLSLKKSICLSGTPGSSKTTVMEALNWALQQIRSPKAFAVQETKNLAVAFEHKTTGGMSAIKGILNPKNNRHIYYDEIGKRMIAEVRHYANAANIDILVLEFREDLWRRGQYMTHSTTNMGREELAEWLTSKYISRFHMISNLIPYENATDYRLSELAAGGWETSPQDSTEDKAEKNRNIALLTVRRFANELIALYQESKPPFTLFSHETAVFSALVSLGYMNDREPVHTDEYYTEAVERMKRDTQIRRGLQTDRKVAKQMGELLELMTDGLAMTTTVQAHLRIAFQKVVLRHFIAERLPDEAAVRRVFKRVMEEDK